MQANSYTRTASEKAQMVMDWFTDGLKDKAADIAIGGAFATTIGHMFSQYAWLVVVIGLVGFFVVSMARDYIRSRRTHETPAEKQWDNEVRQLLDSSHPSK